MVKLAVWSLRQFCRRDRLRVSREERKMTRLVIYLGAARYSAADDEEPHDRVDRVIGHHATDGGRSRRWVSWRRRSKVVIGHHVADRGDGSHGEGGQRWSLDLGQLSMRSGSSNN
jgi:hypothetical protein